MAEISPRNQLFNKIRTTFSIDSLNDIQIQALDFFLESKDVLVCARTGRGKSLCYQALTFAGQHPKNIVLVISPLKTIMEEQVKELNNRRIPSAYIGKSDEDDRQIQDGSIKVVFGSPELIIGSDFWRSVWKSEIYQEKLCAVVVDEAHTVYLWGEDQKHSPAFREWFSRIGEIRSLTSVPMMALTATASDKARKRIMTSLCLRPKSTGIIVESPDRPNISLHVSSVKSTQSEGITFAWLIQKLIHEINVMERHVVFCKSINDCVRVQCAFLHIFGRNFQRVNMYHSQTPETVKDIIKADMGKETSQSSIRVLICTNAAGMGVNFKGITQVVHYGPAQEMDTFLQQIGRAGREGERSQHILLWHKKQLHNVDVEMLKYLRNSDECRRKSMLAMYNVKSPDVNKILPAHKCCDICAKDCTCSECVSHPYTIFLSRVETEDPSSSKDTSKTREVSEYEKSLLRSELDMYREELSSAVAEESGSTINPELVHCFSLKVTDSIIDNCGQMFSADDVMVLSCVCKYSQATHVIKLIGSIFEDIHLDMSCMFEGTCDKDDE